MSLSTTSCSLLLACALAACGGGDEGHGPAAPATSAPAPARPPDVVFVSIDSLRADHLGCYGYPKPTSPTIDRLAAEGVRCATAVTTTSWTLPAHAAMLTGLFDSSHGLVDNGLELAPGHDTLAESMRAAGYQTAGFFGGPYLHASYGFAQGFDRYQSCMTVIADDASVEEIRTGTTGWLARGEVENVTGPRTVAEVGSWLGGVDERPLFLFVHLFDVHYDYIPPKAFLDLFDPDYTGSLDARKLPENPAIHPGMDPRDLEHLLALYDGEIRFTDDTLAKILALLDARGRLADALVVVTSDHGQEFFEHGGKAHQRSLFEEVIRVPLIVRWPGRIAAGKVVPDLVRTVDLMPTILAAVGAPAPGPFDGRDLAPLFRGEALPESPALCELLVDGAGLRALRRTTWKFMSNERNGFSAGFDLAADPGEKTFLPKGSEELARGLADLERTVAAARRSYADRGARAQAITVDPELEKRLRGMGYVGDEDTSPPAPERDD